jgi:hypothetical protein
MLDSTVVCRRALGCEWGGLKHTYGAFDQVIREDPAGAVVVRAWPGHRNIGRGSCRSALADGRGLYTSIR